MADSTRSHSLLAWGLATFHTTFFVTGLATLLYLSGNLGDLLGSLSTIIGMLLFGALWFTTWWSTRRALRGLQWPMLESLSKRERIYRAALWGGVNGALFLLVILGVAVVGSIISILTNPGVPVGSILFLAVVGLVGSVIAFGVGTIFGILFAIIDGALLAISRYSVSVLTNHRSRLTQ
ncbi:MAG: hypothetical protein ACRDH2_03855 [Anaerolineales bacterium]